MKTIILSILTIYKKLVSKTLGVLFGGACRYYPTCSDYSYQAIRTHGFIKGSILSVKRIVSCNYFSKRDFVDLVPSKT